MRRAGTGINRRRFLKQGAAYGLAGAGMMAAGSLLPDPALGTTATAAAANSKRTPVYVFASDPRAVLPGFRTIPG